MYHKRPYYLAHGDAMIRLLPNLINMIESVKYSGCTNGEKVQAVGMALAKQGQAIRLASESGESLIQTETELNQESPKRRGRKAKTGVTKQSAFIASLSPAQKAMFKAELG